MPCVKLKQKSRIQETPNLSTDAKGRVQLKILVVFTTKARPPPPGKALVVQNRQKCFTKLLSSWSDPGKKITKDLVVGPTPPPRS